MELWHLEILRELYKKYNLLIEMKVLNHKHIKEAILIRRVEETFLELFSEGKLNGTVHTCVGQEFSAVAFAGQLRKHDFVFSNHRCHGHYISFTKDIFGLIAELMGKKSGTCGGVGSSQHLCNNNFYSNGIQGGILPVSAGYVLSNKLAGNKNIGVVYIGDGTLGEGVLYETMNIISKWEIPLLIVCENNFYAQSTPQSVNLAGDILKRAEAFDIKTFKSDTWDVEDLMSNAKASIDYVRDNNKPCFHLVETYRLNAHSKGDDNRDKNEVREYVEKDYIVSFEKTEKLLYQNYLQIANEKIQIVLDSIENNEELSLDEYYSKESVDSKYEWLSVQTLAKRQVELLNEFFQNKIIEDKKTFFIGEDILSPYGGAFKVAKNLSTLAPDRTLSTPISEAALSGIANGLALAGNKPYAEIMFGDFITLAFDQILNHASKFYHMYNKKATCPVVIRTPMGGNRGYGPTHSQTLDKFLCGIDNVKTIALSTFINPALIYESIHKEPHPVIVIENKTDYGKKIGSIKPENYEVLMNTEVYPVVKARPIKSIPNTTIVTYGSNGDWILENIHKLFMETDVIAEVIILTKISPIDYNVILDSISLTQNLVVIEEGSKFFGVGSEIIAGVLEKIDFQIRVSRIGALDVPIPSVRSLESQVLPNIDLVVKTVNNRNENITRN
jgi:2-oxoisovalerate dehydrogenase E1 component